MGKRHHNAAAMNATRDALKAGGVDAFAYSHAATRGQADIHPALDPAMGGKRLSLDPSPTERAFPVTIMLDVTGSNRRNAQEVYDALPQFFGLVTVQGWLKDHLNLQIGAIGDATCDRFPLQLSQFEADGETVDKWLRCMVLEGGGGGQDRETYELAMWALVNQNQLQVWERGGKGQLFIIFDEAPYDVVRADLLRDIYRPKPVAGAMTDSGEISWRMAQPSNLDLPAQNISIDEMARQLKAKYNVYGIIGSKSSYYTNDTTLGIWKRILGEERIIKLEQPGEVPQLIAALLGQQNGIPQAQILSDLQALGTTSLADISTAMTAIVATSPQPPSASSRIQRL